MPRNEIGSRFTHKRDHPASEDERTYDASDQRDDSRCDQWQRSDMVKQT
jgi:hypothetical protein